LVIIALLCNKLQAKVQPHLGSFLQDKASHIRKHAKHYSGDEIQNKMTMACNAYRRWDRCIKGVGGDMRQKPLGKPRRRCEDININLPELGWGGKNWIDLA
jgi:hypothetical protein